jgi:Leucine-rich repeat (LRR) protein
MGRIVFGNCHFDVIPMELDSVFKNMKFGFAVYVINHDSNQVVDFIKSLSVYNIIYLILIDMNFLTMPNLSGFKSLERIKLENIDNIIINDSLPPLAGLVWINNAKSVSFPSDIVLDKIRILSIDIKNMAVLPKNIFNIVELETLAISSSSNYLLKDFDLKSLSELKGLSKLTELIIGKVNLNQIGIPESILDFNALNNLTLSSDSLKTISPNIIKLTNLEKIFLSYNCLEEFPIELLKLPKIRYIYLNDNKIKNFPSNMKEVFTSELFILLSNNPLTPEAKKKFKEYFPNARIFFSD